MKKIVYILLLIVLFVFLNNNVTFINNLISNINVIINSSSFTFFVIGMSVITFYDNTIKKLINYFKSQYNKSKAKYLNETKR